MKCYRLLPCLLLLLGAACTRGPQPTATHGGPGATEETVDGKGNPADSGHAPSVLVTLPNTPSNADRLRLPDMETLPEPDELKPVKPRDGGIIARPPVE